MISRARIIGLGSPVQGDELGMQLVNRLSMEPAFQADNIDVVVLERPGVSLLQYFNNIDTVCLVDVLVDKNKKGIVQIDPNELLTRQATLSSHNFGVAETLQLASTLGKLPPHLYIYGANGGTELYPDLFRTLVADLNLEKTPSAY